MKKNRKHKSKFPSFLTFSSCRKKRSQAIITDAGFQSINYDLALNYFSFSDIYDYWESNLYLEDVEEELIEELDNLETILPKNIYNLNYEQSLELINKIIQKCQLFPKFIEVAVAKAVYGLEYRWVKIIDITDSSEGWRNIDNYEEQAISLGLKMKQEIGNNDLIIINDNKHAVSNMSGYPPYVWTISKQIGETSSQIFWSPRKTVSVADKLSIQEATQVFCQQDYDFMDVNEPIDDSDFINNDFF